MSRPPRMATRFSRRFRRPNGRIVSREPCRPATATPSPASTSSTPDAVKPSRAFGKSALPVIIARLATLLYNPPHVAGGRGREGAGMPWSNNSGGGGWKGGGGPWGGGPQQRGPQPPDLEELLKRSQDRLRNVLPGGGRSNVVDRRADRRGALRDLGLQQPLHGAARRARSGAGLRQAEGRSLHPGPAFHLLADRNRGDRSDPRRSGNSSARTSTAATAPTRA